MLDEWSLCPLWTRDPLHPLGSLQSPLDLQVLVKIRACYCCPQACVLNAGIQDHVPNSASCPQGRNDLQMPKEAQSYYVTHMKHVYKHGWFLAAQRIAIHLRRPYLQCLHPKHVLHLPSMIAHSKNRRTQSQCRSFQPGLEQVLQLQAQCKARLT